MNSKLGWALVALAFAVGWWAYGWQGLLMALTVTVFWLLLQFSRALRVMKNAADSPVGHVASAVMFQSRLKPGLNMMQVVGMTKSLGRKQGNSGDVWRWADDGGNQVEVLFERGRCQRWQLVRTTEVEPGCPAIEA